ncbi:NAD-dependent succinate-semialdehyde dehydrogenase [Castellaniella sp.]|uniref:NAD-dependent succinate-semialdehyde dehydrogenase n=1 Tax=Castellaniella sp. TaxID=1955812 RepID=UPI00355DB74D
MLYPQPGLFINGHWIDQSRDALAVLNPATVETLGQLPMASPADIARAIAAAHQAFRTWRRTPARTRAAILQRTARILLDRKEKLARIITLELGKPLAESRAEVDTAIGMFEWHAEEAPRTYGRIIPGREPLTRQMAVLEPVGPVAAFSGWNAPAITPSRKIAGALAAGCTIVLKPAEETPATACEIGRALQEAGVPEGVVNLVFGNPGAISDQLLAAEEIRALTFTGSTVIGRALAQKAAAGLKRATLELGGHAPVLVFEDADMESAIRHIATAKFRNSGQVCTSPTRIYVQEAMYETFCNHFAERAAALKIGNGLDESVQMGPLANPRRLAAMQALTRDALEKGATLLCGGDSPSATGWFWAPTVLCDYPDHCDAAHIEPFGPMALLHRFTNLDDAIAKANRLPFGLAAYAFTNRADQINVLGQEVESGVICFNHCRASLPETPFGGVKDSGLGREGGTEGLREFLQVKYLSQAS